MGERGASAPRTPGCGCKRRAQRCPSAGRLLPPHTRNNTPRKNAPKAGLCNKTRDGKKVHAVHGDVHARRNVLLRGDFAADDLVLRKAHPAAAGGRKGGGGGQKLCAQTGGGAMGRWTRVLGSKERAGGTHLASEGFGDREKSACGA